MRIDTKNYAQALYQTVKESKGEALKLAIKNFVRLIKEKRLIGLAPKIIADFIQYYNETEKIVAVKVVSALDLSETMKDEIKSRIKALTGKKVELTTETDPALIGGVKIIFADNLIDGSLKTQLENLKKQLLLTN